ncbi:MAG: tyrosine-type recombinase/integrase [Actinomycetota bacterium]|nr:tyrosine-type recombinase/integrase [Actinomycetota bacterium]
MSDVAQLIEDYLRLRRSLGFKLERSGLLLVQFHQHLQEKNITAITVEVMGDWAILPGGKRQWHAARLGTLRSFARWAHVFDSTIEVPPAGLLPAQGERLVAFVYSSEEITALMAAASEIHTPLVAATYRTLIGLLAATGLRVGEAIRANRRDLTQGVLTVADTKFGKTRLVPLHPTTVAVLDDYARLRDEILGQVPTDALFVSLAGTRLIYKNVAFVFHRLVGKARILPRSSRCRPRLHDLRHTFAVSTMLDAYRHDRNAAEVLPILSTYLGHASPGSTYWYLQADPHLLAAAAERRSPVADAVRMSS